MNGTHGPGPAPGPGPESPGRLGRPESPREGRWAAGDVVAYLRRHWFLTLAALIVLLVLAIRFLRHPAEESDEGAPAVVNAQTGVARVGDFAVTIDALGTVQPRPGSFAQVAAPAASRVARILVATGDHVRPGQPLVQLDESVWVLQAQQAQIALDAAQKAYDRAQRLFDEGISPRKDVETAAADLAKAKADLEAARRTEALGTLRSPIAGVVTQMRASLAQPVDVNQPLVEVVNPAGLEVLFHLSPTDAARLAPGGAVELTAVSEAGPAGPGAGAGNPATSTASAPAQFLGRGTITGISAAVDSATGSVAVRATVAAPVVPLKAGQTVSGHLVVAHHPRAVIVPVSALVPAGDSVQVFVVDAKSIAHATPVTVGARNELEAEVTSGLRGGETIVTAGAYGVTDSATIKRPGTGPTENAPKGEKG